MLRNIAIILLMIMAIYFCICLFTFAASAGTIINGVYRAEITEIRPIDANEKYLYFLNMGKADEIVLAMERPLW